MIELELLGVSPDGQKLSLNDAEGNRYSLAITDRVRAALRKDLPTPTTEPKPITPREIQAMFRAGHELNDVAQLSSLPAAQLLALEHPIAAERSYMAQQARQYRQAHELGGLTVDELVTSRLVERGVSADGISWNAYREPGSPWTLCASYCVAGQELTALWQINTKSQSVSALNDEATWLTETAVPAPSSPWRAHNTPQVAHIYPTSERSGTHINDHAPTDISAHMSARDDRDNSEFASEQSIDIDSVLAELDSQRGRSRPMPNYEEYEGEGDTSSLSSAESPEGTAGAEARASRDNPDGTESPIRTSDISSSSSDTSDSTSSAGISEDEERSESADQGATIVQFPRQQHLPGMGSLSDSSSADLSEEELAKKEPREEPAEEPAASHRTSQPHSRTKHTQETKKATPSHKKKRRDRPAMPSWDEIVFGYSKEDPQA